MFIGREREMRSLERELERVGREQAGGRPGRCVLVRGRRRVGKSRLLEEFCASADVPSVFFTASRQGAGELALFGESVAESDLPNRDLLVDAAPTSWDAMLRLLATVLDDSGPTIVVIDEFPYLVDDDPSLEATFQKQWDRLLSRRPVMLVLVGSDLAMMESLNTHGRAFFQRGVELVVPPLSPIETATAVGTRGAAEAFDAHLVTGGLPLFCNDWPRGASMWDYLDGALMEPTSPLIVSAERVLAAELSPQMQARVVLGQIGAGEVSFSTIARAAGGLQATSLHRSLATLAQKRMVAREVPLSVRPSKEARYRIADSYLSFWLRFIGPHLAEIERGRGDRVAARIRRDWTTWRGKAIEPIVREALTRLSPIEGLGSADAVGGYWTRTNTPEIDLIGADTGPIAKRIVFAGSIKWRADEPLDRNDLARLDRDLAAVPGVDSATPRIAVSCARPSTSVARRVAVTLGAADLLAAW